MTVEHSKFAFFWIISYSRATQKNDTNLKKVYIYLDYGRNITCLLHSNKLSLLIEFKKLQKPKLLRLYFETKRACGINFSEKQMITEANLRKGKVFT